jgi:pantoate--beta-alanine ligase
MKIIENPVEMQNEAQGLRRKGKRIGLVPTMGYLHEGHLSLMRLARERADIVAVSVFVNPTQFGPNEDYDRYPRDFERDASACLQAGADWIFHPSPESLYAPDYSVYVADDRLSRFLCGASRPTHFRGVCTIVCKLFNLVLPDVAVFGAKDAQQVRIIRRMVRDLNLPVEIAEAPTVREADGLAMSSRNALLTPGERRQATCLRRALDRAESLHRAGERDADLLAREMKKIIQREPDARVDYAQIVDNETLEPVIEIERPALAAIAVNFSKARLVDNTVLI